ncbi:MAG: lipid IV(A) 3-deoxy-D-manno-octulosonic acid transferase [Steroidobacter sp.]
MLIRTLYLVLIHLAAPIVWVLTALRGLSDRSYWDRLPERLGYTALRFTTQPIWIHAASVGEVQAATPLIRYLLARHSSRPLLITTVTPTGAARVHSLFGAGSNLQPDQQARHAFLPYDTPLAVRRFLRGVNPYCLIVMETELWPTLLSVCTRKKLPVVLASARVSSKTATRYATFRPLFANSLAHVYAGTQTVIDAERLQTLGVPQTHLQVTGNLKFDIEIAADISEAGKHFRTLHAAHRPVWIAGSTHEGEEPLILAAHQGVLKTFADALLIIAPRHPQRFQNVTALLRSQNISFVTRSSAAPLSSGHTVLLLDTLGELTQFYAASDIAFVGGSLVPVGGHNLLEPAALSLPVLTGPYTFNAPDIAQRLSDGAGLRYVYSADELATVVTELFSDSSRRVKQGSAAFAAVQESRGALSRLAALIETQCRLN